ncbi:MAG: hypothetical protein ACKOCU_06290 [Betaproteobacteria bacterium]
MDQAEDASTAIGDAARVRHRRTPVRFRIPPPKALTKSSMDDNFGAFFILKTMAYRLGGDKGFCGLTG